MIKKDLELMGIIEGNIVRVSYDTEYGTQQSIGCVQKIGGTYITFMIDIGYTVSVDPTKIIGATIIRKEYKGE